MKSTFLPGAACTWPCFVILYAPILYLMIFSFSAGKTMENIAASPFNITPTSADGG